MAPKFKEIKKKSLRRWLLLKLKSEIEGDVARQSSRPSEHLKFKDILGHPELYEILSQNKQPSGLQAPIHLYRD